MSSPQIIIILKKFKDLFACKIALAANHHYPEVFQGLFRLQKCLRSKSWLSWKYSKTFRLQNCLSRKSSLSWKHSKTFSLAKLSSTQIIFILKLFKNFFACKIVLDANHHYPENNQRHFPCKIVLDANHHYPENIQRLFRLQNCLSRKSSLSWKNSKTLSSAKLSLPQIIFILIIFKDFFAGRIVLDANHQYPEIIQRLFRLQNCLSRKSSLSWKNSKTLSSAKLS